ncbi:MAG: DUF2752 domain-containing protein [Mycoplasmatota bacterium]|nr:DUF2752 domain-containing protein [Mycoplasmatota bacterium]
MLNRLKKILLKNIIFISIFLIYYYLNHTINLKIVCPFYTITGLLCPGCGITRCLFAIINGNLKQAIHYNLLVSILLPPFIIYYIYQEYIYLFNKQNKIKEKIPRYTTTIILIITILFGIIRNIK